MPIFKAERHVAVPPDIAFAVAADVGSYKEFLPLLTRSVVRGSKTQTATGEKFSAELAVAYAKLGLAESFASEVETDNVRGTVTAKSSAKPFRAIETQWTISSSGSGSTVAIKIDYSFRNPMLQVVASGLMDMAVQKIMTAFETRAKSMARDT